MYVVTVNGRTIPDSFRTRGQAIRGMVRAAKAQDLTPYARRALAKWYTSDKYRAISETIRIGRVYTMSLGTDSGRVVLTILPPIPPIAAAPHLTPVPARCA
jgi:hypothetical protein